MIGLRVARCALRVSCQLPVARCLHATRNAQLATLLVFFAACARTPSVPTYKVEAIRFARRVTADGNLKSTKATPLTAPTDAPGPLKIAWIVPDGALLKKD